MNLAVVALLIPTAFHFSSEAVDNDSIENLSVAVAIVLMGARRH
jgi:Ca2+/H+ antiporter